MYEIKSPCIIAKNIYDFKGDCTWGRKVQSPDSKARPPEHNTKWSTYCSRLAVTRFTLSESPKIMSISSEASCISG